VFAEPVTVTSAVAIDPAIAATLATPSGIADQLARSLIRNRSSNSSALAQEIGPSPRPRRRSQRSTLGMRADWSSNTLTPASYCYKSCDTSLADQGSDG
jgi:hypothetical protein